VYEQFVIEVCFLFFNKKALLEVPGSWLWNSHGSPARTKFCPLLLFFFAFFTLVVGCTRNWAWVLWDKAVYWKGCLRSHSPRVYFVKTDRGLVVTATCCWMFSVTHVKVLSTYYRKISYMLKIQSLW